ncbi:hypothetical protein TNCV_4403791 [Trichonephila clavipes]|uniref:Uncharacterized protein n=1 Tax=Trichonephila clavipes TaxID=2585209 RepID=A0A8X6SAD1_TRICX|nr:hypothetical protein TNCV_4403791 [Trichonephila clavipes]
MGSHLPYRTMLGDHFLHHLTKAGRAQQTTTRYLGKNGLTRETEWDGVERLNYLEASFIDCNNRQWNRESHTEQRTVDGRKHKLMSLRTFKWPRKLCGHDRHHFRLVLGSNQMPMNTRYV